MTDEELTAFLRDLPFLRAAKAADRIEALTDKLAKAVGALTDIVKDCEAEYPPSHGAIKYFCRTTLAEIEGSTSEGENG
jgi:hypothetical protein